MSSPVTGPPSNNSQGGKPNTKPNAAAKMSSKEPQTSSLTTCHLQVLGTGGGELKPCLLLFTDSKRYLFNCVENVQRFSQEHKVRLSKTSHVFFTRMAWDNVGGLPGLSLHFSHFCENFMFPIHLHGPEALADFVQSMKFHLNPEKFSFGDPLEDVQGHLLPTYRDENITVRTLTLHATSEPEQAGFVSSDSNTEEDEVSNPDSPPRSKKPKVSLPPSSTLAFLCKLCDVRGKFNAHKAEEFGIPNGPLYKSLARGESVTAPNGRIIHSHEVLGPTRHGPSFVVLECPNEGFISSLTTHPLLQKSAFDASDQNLVLIVHITPRAVLQSEKYCQWMASFGPHTRHLLLHETLCPRDWVLRNFLKNHVPLNLLQPSLFHMPPVLNPTHSSTDDLTVFQHVPAENVIVGNTLLNYHLKPLLKLGVDRSHQLQQTFAEHRQEQVKKTESHSELKKALEQASKELKQAPRMVSDCFLPSKTVPTSSEDAVITFLGTGASCPSGFRNVSGILLQTAFSGNVLLDCGEGTLSQLYRHFGREEGDRVLSRLDKIFISHIHGDHNLGVISILNRRAEILQRAAAADGVESLGPTVVLAPRRVLWWLNEYRNKCQRINYRFVECDSLTDAAQPVGGDENLTFQTVPVVHCKWSYGVVVSCGVQWRMVYSGDTRPCHELARVGRNATLLLHEATFEDDMLEDSKKKKHCTVSEALEIAEEMNSDFTILTHFSQRYPNILPVVSSKNPGLQSKVFSAFDHMTVSLSELHGLPALLPVLQDILKCTVDEDDVPAYWGW